MDNTLELINYNRLYNACKGILRIKQAGIRSTMWDFGKEIGSEYLSGLKDNFTYAYDPRNEALARGLNDRRYMEALAAINNGEYNGYKATDDVDSTSISSIGVTDKQLDEMADRRLEERKNGRNGRSMGITINNNIPRGNSGGYGYGAQSYGDDDYQPGLADYMRSYILGKYRNR